MFERCMYRACNPGTQTSLASYDKCVATDNMAAVEEPDHS